MSRPCYLSVSGLTILHGHNVPGLIVLYSLKSDL